MDFSSGPSVASVTFFVLIEYVPSRFTSSTIWFGGELAGASEGVGSGSCTSTDFRMLGIAAMKMMSSTSSTSIMGVTLGSFVSPPLPPEENAILFHSRRTRRLGVTDDRARRTRPLVADEPHHAHA